MAEPEETQRGAPPTSPEASAAERQKPIVREVTLTFALVFAAVLLSTALHPVFGDESALLVSAAFLIGALRRATQHGFSRFGISLGGLMGPLRDDGSDDAAGPWLARPESFSVVARVGLPSALREIGLALLLITAIFPPFAVLFAFWNGVAFADIYPSVPVDFATTMAGHLVVVALPEEAFFRGYVQTRLGDAYDPEGRGRVLGAKVAPKVLLLQAVLFGLVHLGSSLHPARLATFFPGLLFGWLRGRRGGIGAAIVVHAASNGLSIFLHHSWAIT